MLLKMIKCCHCTSRKCGPAAKAAASASARPARARPSRPSSTACSRTARPLNLLGLHLGRQPNSRFPSPSPAPARLDLDRPTGSDGSARGSGGIRGVSSFPWNPNPRCLPLLSRAAWRRPPMATGHRGRRHRRGTPRPGSSPVAPRLFFLFLPFPFFYRAAAAIGHGGRGKTRTAALPWLSRRRARSPDGERAAVE